MIAICMYISELYEMELQYKYSDICNLYTCSVACHVLCHLLYDGDFYILDNPYSLFYFKYTTTICFYNL